MLCAAAPAKQSILEHTFDRLSFESLAAACRGPALSWRWQPLLECRPALLHPLVRSALHDRG